MEINKTETGNDYYVSPLGNDENNGSKQNPFLTINHTMQVIDKNKESINGDITVFLAGGNYFLDDTIRFRVSDSLPNNHTLIFKAIEGEEPVINGGRLVENWENTEVNGRSILRAKMDNIEFARNFYVNGEPRLLASIFQSKGDRKSWGWIPHTNMTSFEVRFGDFGKINNPKQLEVVWHSEWKTFIYRAESITYPNIINMKQPYFERITSIIRLGQEVEHDPNGYWWPNPARHPLYLQNDINFIDKPGEFCFDEETKYLYYYPLENEDIEKCEAIVPFLDELINIEGEGKNGTIPKRVKNITFDGITFAYPAFSFISKEGLAINQAQSVYAGSAKLTDGRLDICYGQLSANININYAENINFLNCTFKNTTGGALYFHDGVQGAVVNGCIFKEIGDSAIMIGDGTTGYFDEENITKNITVKNCLFRKLGRINHSAPGIQAYFARNLELIHNDIYDTPYSGIAVGWGWVVCLNSIYSQNNIIDYNKVGNFNNQVRDGGGIYTLGQQPNSYCRYNYIYEQMEAFGGIYHDEGTAFYTTTHNVVDNNSRIFDTEQRWLNLNGFDNGPNGWKSVYACKVDHNFTSNKRIGNSGEPSNLTVTDTIYVEDGNWPEEAKEIMQNAGLEEEYKHLFNKL